MFEVVAKEIIYSIAIERTLLFPWEVFSTCVLHVYPLLVIPLYSSQKITLSASKSIEDAKNLIATNSFHVYLLI